jgi:hypothetical protein
MMQQASRVSWVETDNSFRKFKVMILLIYSPIMSLVSWLKNNPGKQDQHQIKIGRFACKRKEMGQKYFLCI